MVLTFLSKAMEAIHLIQDQHLWRNVVGIAIREDSPAEILLQFLRTVHLKGINKTLIYREPAVIQRILLARRWARERELIATVSSTPDLLVIRDCAFRTHEIPMASVPVLRKLPRDVLMDVQVDELGEFLYWPRADVHLSLEHLILCIDPVAAARARSERLIHTRRFGLAVRIVREAHHLRQGQITGLSEREIRRVESGTTLPREFTLNRLARAHSLSLSEYLDEVSKVLVGDVCTKAATSNGKLPLASRR